MLQGTEVHQHSSGIDMGIGLATVILSAAENGKPLDIAVHDEGKKEGKTYLTVTSAK